jgi:hypothetical protein
MRTTSIKGKEKEKVKITDPEKIVNLETEIANMDLHILPTGPTKAKAKANHAAKERGRATPEETDKMIPVATAGYPVTSPAIVANA